MPVPSSLSVICSSVREFVRTELDAAANNFTVSLGSPALVAGNDSDNRLNLFFYRFEPGGFESDQHPNDPWRIRMFCLVTAFGAADDSITAGENDLRMLGEVLRLFHQTPILGGVDVDGQDVRLRVVFSPSGDDRINQIWSTQGDATYRPSVLYEMALTPIVPSEPRVPPTLVGALGTQIEGRMEDRHAAFNGSVAGPRVPALRVDVANPSWTPAVAWIYDGALAHTLAFDVVSPEFAGFNPEVWVAGDPAETVELVWEVWAPDGWQEAGAVVVSNPFSTGIDPDAIPAPVPGTFPTSVALPIAVPPGETAAQAMLYARRDFSPDPSVPPVRLRSNPLLVSLYRSP